MKKILILLFIIGILLFTAGCFGSVKEYKPEFEGQKFETEEISIFVPDEFENVETFDSSYPQETIVGFKNKEKTDNFNANVNVIKIAVSESLSAESLAKQKIKTHESSLEEFKKLAEKEIELKIGEKNQKTILYLFEGKVKTVGKKLKFLQTFAVGEKNGFIITGTFAATEKEEVVKKIEGMLKSFALK